MYRAVKVSLESLPLLVAALRDSEVQMSTWMKILLILSMTTIIVIKITTINDGVGIDEDNNNDDEAGDRPYFHWDDFGPEGP